MASLSGERRRALSARVQLLRRLGSIFHVGAAAVAAGVVLFVVGLIIVLTAGAWSSITRFGWGFLGGSTWDGVHNIYGAFPAIVGTLLSSAIALCLAVPLALGVAIFLSEASPPRWRRPLATIVDLSAAVPSVVYGFWAFIVLVPLLRSSIEPRLRALTGGSFPFNGQPAGLDLLNASIVLAVMILPTVAALSREALQSVPRIQRESALSLGATRWEATRIAVFGPARLGIVAGIILGLGRALAETIAVAMVIGNIYAVPTSLFSPTQTLASEIANNFGEVGIGLELNALVELGLILLAITVVVNIVARGFVWALADRPSRQSRPVAGSGQAGQGARREEFISLARRLTAAPGALSTGVHSWRKRVAAAAPERVRRRRRFEWVILGLTLLCLVLAVVPLASVITTAAERGGLAAVTPSFYVSEPPIGCNPRPGVHCTLGGLGPAIQGTLIMLSLGAAIAIPGGLLAGIYVSEYGRGGGRVFGRIVSFIADVLTGVPTILLGVFVFILFLTYDHDSALSALSGGVALGAVMIPIVTRATEESLRQVPLGVREAALALGFPRHRVTLRVVLGTARGALVTGVLLALSRAAGDTAALYVTAGNSSFWFAGFDKPTAAITPFIFENFSSEYANLQTDAWGAALVLLLIMLVISVGVRFVTGTQGATPEAE